MQQVAKSSGRIQNFLWFWEHYPCSHSVSDFNGSRNLTCVFNILASAVKKTVLHLARRNFDSAWFKV